MNSDLETTFQRQNSVGMFSVHCSHFTNTRTLKSLPNVCRCACDAINLYKCFAQASEVFSTYQQTVTIKARQTRHPNKLLFHEHIQRERTLSTRNYGQQQTKVIYCSNANAVAYYMRSRLSRRTFMVNATLAYLTEVQDERRTGERKSRREERKTNETKIST